MNTAHFVVTPPRGHARGKKSLTFKEQKRVIALLVKYQVKNIVFTGGEPFLSPDFPELVQYALKRKCMVGIETNGHFIQKKHMSFLKKTAFVQLSLEGLFKEHRAMKGINNFDKVVDTIKLLKKHKVPVTTNFTMTTLNYRCIDQYIPFIDSLGLSYANFTRLYYEGDANRNFNTLHLPYQDFIRTVRKIGVWSKKVQTPLRIHGPLPLFTIAGLKNLQHGRIGEQKLSIYPNGSVTLFPRHKQVVGNILDKKVIPVLRLLQNTDQKVVSV